MRTIRLAACALALVLVACEREESPEEEAAEAQAQTDSARTAIMALAASMAAHISAGHADSVADYYAESAIVMPPNEPAVTGRAAIREWNQKMATMMGSGAMHFTVQNVTARDDMAVERGRWHWAGSAMSDSGKYLAHWHRVEGRWMLVEDIFNSDTPAAPPPPARRR